MGAHQVLDPANGSPFDSVKAAVVFEAVGVPGIIDDILLRARPGTRLVVAGVCMQPDTVHPFFAIAKEINVQFVLAYNPEEFAGSLRALAEGEIDATPMITGEVGLDASGRGIRRPRRSRTALQDPRNSVVIVRRNQCRTRPVQSKLCSNR